MVTELFDRVERTGLIVLFDVNRAGWLENLVNIQGRRWSHCWNSSDRYTDPGDQQVGRFRGWRWWRSAVTAPGPQRDGASGRFLTVVMSRSRFRRGSVYGTAEALRRTGLPLGSLSVHESGVLRISRQPSARLRHNPSFGFTADHALEWLGRNTSRP